jgi:hypothetical protein
MLAKLSRHTDDLEDALGLALAIAHPLARAGGGTEERPTASRCSTSATATRTSSRT